MTELCDFKENLRRLIEGSTNILTVTDRFEGKAELGYAVNARELESKVIDGGRQLERAFEVTLTIWHTKPEKDDGTLKKRLYDSIFPYFQLENRRFVPLDAKDSKTEGSESITFTVRFCDSLERDSVPIELMGNITFNIISGGKNGITTDSHQF